MLPHWRTQSLLASGQPCGIVLLLFWQMRKEQRRFPTGLKPENQLRAWGLPGHPMPSLLSANCTVPLYLFWDSHKEKPVVNKFTINSWFSGHGLTLKSSFWAPELSKRDLVKTPWHKLIIWITRDVLVELISRMYASINVIFRGLHYRYKYDLWL